MNGNYGSRRKIRRTTDDIRNTKYEIRNTKLVFALWSLVISLALAGCASQQQSEAAADGGTKQVCLGDVDKAHAMQAAENVLAGLHFKIEKADTEAGLIRTHPLSGAQFFEFWRKDSVGSFNKTEANLHSIRRTVELQISRNNDDTCIACQVTTQRLNLPEMEVSSSARAYALFSRSSDSLQRMTLNPEQEAGVAWVDLGKDGPLASEVLERIEGQFSALGGKN